MTQQTDPAAGMAEMQTHCSRADTKASLLLALAGAGGLALVNALAGELPVVARVAGTASGAAFGMAVVLLLTVVRPSIPHKFTAERAIQTDSVEQLDRLCDVANRKYQLLKHAVDALYAAVGLAALTAVITTF
ncbi:hypothetical protein ACFC1B_07200 [Streptomyces xiamenensis]|uniref:hypothetical protein n=1 Tax=Streptomyces xiamenensis TaxID=408015 RepID=UPI0035DE2491